MQYTVLKAVHSVYLFIYLYFSCKRIYVYFYQICTNWGVASLSVNKDVNKRSISSHIDVSPFPDSSCLHLFIWDKLSTYDSARAFGNVYGVSSFIFPRMEEKWLWRCCWKKHATSVTPPVVSLAATNGVPSSMMCCRGSYQLPSILSAWLHFPAALSVAARPCDASSAGACECMCTPVSSSWMRKTFSVIYLWFGRENTVTLERQLERMFSKQRLGRVAGICKCLP